LIFFFPYLNFKYKDFLANYTSFETIKMKFIKQVEDLEKAKLKNKKNSFYHEKVYPGIKIKNILPFRIYS